MITGFFCGVQYVTTKYLCYVTLSDTLGSYNLWEITNTYSVKFSYINLLKPTGHVMHHKFNIQQLYVLPTLYLCVLYLSENKQRLVPLTAQTDWFL